MSAHIKLVVGLVISTFIYPIGIFLLFASILGITSLYEWYLSFWGRGSHIFRIYLETMFSWGAIKFYLLAWGVGMVMVLFLTYRNFKPEIQENPASPWGWLVTLGNVRRRYINSFARSWMRAVRPKRKHTDTRHE